MLDGLDEKAHALDDAARRETQRRTDAEQEFSSVLPPDVSAILTEGDEAERKAEEVHYKSHEKLTETVRKFFSKLEAEEERYRERKAELQDANNPDAEETMRQRYLQVRGLLVL